MKRLRAFLGRLRSGRRPPTGPLTTSEAKEAEVLRLATRANEDERQREQKKGPEPNSSSD
jgi:hypothetical protein